MLIAADGGGGDCLERGIGVFYGVAFIGNLKHRDVIFAVAKTNDTITAQMLLECQDCLRFGGAAGLDLPQCTAVAQYLITKDLPVHGEINTPEQCAEAILNAWRSYNEKD